MTTHKYTILYIFAACMALLFTGCKPDTRHDDNKAREHSSLKYARMFTLCEHDGYTEVNIIDPNDSTKIKDRFILLPEGVKAPAPSQHIMVIPVPVKSAVVYTSVHGAVMDELGVANVIKGVADANYFKTPSIADGIRNGSIRNVGVSSSPSAEKIIELAPGVIILNSYEGMTMHGVDKLGIPVIKMAENLEKTPLGRAEWIKLIGALTGTRAKADSIFNSVEKRYNELTELGNNVKTRPKVLTENMYEGIWYLPGGNSYQAQLLVQAGGNYPWCDNDSYGSINLSFEEVFDRAGDADVWLLKLMRPDFSYRDLVKMDSRYANFKAAKLRNVYFADTRNGFLFEETPFHPDRLLHDYIRIFSNKTDSLYYFKKMAD